MKVAGLHTAMLIKRLATISLYGRAGATAAREHRHGRLQPCVVKGMAAQQASIECQLLHAQTAEPALHHNLTGQQPHMGWVLPSRAVTPSHSASMPPHSAQTGLPWAICWAMPSRNCRFSCRAGACSSG